MDKKIWAIAGVISVQLGATWFFGGGLMPEEPAELAPPSQSYTAHILRNIYSRREPQIAKEDLDGGLNRDRFRLVLGARLFARGNCPDLGTALPGVFVDSICRRCHAHPPA